MQPIRLAGLADGAVARAVACVVARAVARVVAHVVAHVVVRGAAVAGVALAASLAPSAHAQDGAGGAGAHPFFDKGVATYKQFCSHCHGPDMVNPGTSSYDLRKWPTDRQADFYDVLENGRGSMPAWGDILLPEEMDALWVYVGSRGGEAGLPPLDGLLTAPPADLAPAPENPPGPEAPVVPDGDAMGDRTGLEAELLESGTLRACLPRNGRIMSGWRQDGGAGFDYAVAAWLADELDLTLAVTWAETELEEESDPVRENYAMLAAGWCDVVPGHPSYEGAVGEPVGPRAALPRLMGAPSTSAPPRQVDLAPVRVSHPYLRVETGIVFREDVVRDGETDALGPGSFPDGLADLEGLDVGIEQGTLAGLLTRRQAPASVVRRSVTEVPGSAFLWTLESGGFDAALVDVPVYDHHLRQNPISTLALADWRHPLGFNIGAATLEGDAALGDAIDAVLRGEGAAGTLASLAEREGLHWAAPREPLVQGRFTLETLVGAGAPDAGAPDAGAPSAGGPDERS